MQLLSACFFDKNDNIRHIFNPKRVLFQRFNRYQPQVFYADAYDNIQERG
jgi:hypothetical protein